MHACKNISIVLPYNVYLALKKVSVEQDRSMSEIIRYGLDLALERSKEDMEKCASSIVGGE